MFSYLFFLPPPERVDNIFPSFLEFFSLQAFKLLPFCIPLSWCWSVNMHSLPYSETSLSLYVKERGKIGVHFCFFPPLSFPWHKKLGKHSTSHEKDGRTEIFLIPFTEAAVQAREHLPSVSIHLFTCSKLLHVFSKNWKHILAFWCLLSFL